MRRGMPNSPAATCASAVAIERTAVARDMPRNSAPVELRSLPRWVLWCFETRHDRRAKVSYSVTGQWGVED